MKFSVFPQKGTRSARLLLPSVISDAGVASCRVLPRKLISSSGEALANYFAEGGDFIGGDCCRTEGPSVRLRYSDRAAEQIC